MTEVMERFFDLIYSDSDGFVDIVTRSDDGDLVSERWFSWPEDKSAVIKYCTVRSDEDVYCSVAVFSDELRSKDDVNAVTRTVYADADTCHPKNFRLPPSIVVETSLDRWHCWWVLDEEVLAKDASEAAHRLSEAHKDQGIDRGWIISKLLRVPGTANTKYTEPFEVTATYSDEVFTLDTINDVYQDIEINATVDLNAALPTPLPRKQRIDLEQQLDAAGLSSLYLEKPMEGQSWSERAYKLELELFRLGMTAREVFTLMRESACNKYNPENSGELTQTGVRIPKRRNPDEVLWREVLKAQAEYESTAHVEVDESPTKKIEKADFLSTEERRYCIEHPTFIDKYVSWVASRTDSAPTYQHSLAWMLLSCAFGDKGYLPLPWGKTALNLWVLILGDTCQPLDSRVLTPNGWTTVGEIKEGDYVIGSNGTPTRVSAVKNTKTDDVYTLTLHNGSVVEATGDHLWPVTFNGKSRVETTAWIKRQCDLGYWPIIQPLSGPVEFSKRDLPVDPYVLGVWLAEGCRDPNGYQARFASDGELVDAVARALPDELELVHYGSDERMVYDIRRKDVHRTGPQGLNTVRDGLRDLGLITEYQKYRWIPEDYLFSSIEDRLSLLQGIMDGDGSAGKNGSARFECISERLTRDVALLAKSLGLSVGNVREANPTTAGNRVFRVNIRMVDHEVCPFRLARKAERLTIPSHTHNGVKSVTFSRTTDVRCFEVEAEDSLYVTDDFVVTHNTRTRKSTAKSLFLHAVHLLEGQVGGKIDMGSETTAEGLVMELGQRDGLVSLFHRDEFNGFLSEMMTKNYRQGTLETFTDLYDGQVPVVLRASKDSGNKNRAKTVFNLVGVGIRKRVAQVLTKEYFESGFLARMLWSVADPPPRKKGSEDIRFEEDSVRFDPVLDEMVDDLARRVHHWLETSQGITMDTASLNRYNRWAEEAIQSAERYGDDDILVPSFQRMKISVAKAAALLAMYDQTTLIGMNHLLPALQQGELWFNDMIRMASEVSSSEYERRLDEIVAHISTGAEQQMLDSSVRRKFAKLRPREMDEAISSLVAQGRIRKVKDAKQKWEVL